MYTPKSNLHVAVIGGGAAGLMAAGTLLEQGAEVTIFEHMPKTGLKLGITGKGRCNVTNNCETEEFLKNVVSNPRFLYAAISQFTPNDTISFFESHGVPLKTERGNRVFPQSDSALDIVRCLRQYASNAKIISGHVQKILVKDGAATDVVTKEQTYPFDRIILATGGCSYPATGSDGSGFTLARTLGHTIMPIIPSLVPLISPNPLCKELQGLSLKNVGLKVFSNEKPIYEDFGEMLFTHFGLSGPMILSSSAHIRNESFDHLVYEIDLKPAIDDKELDQRLLRIIEEHHNKDFVNILGELLPQKMIVPFANLVGIPLHKKVHELTKVDRKNILQTLKHFRIQVTSFQIIKDAIVTAGGVSTKEISPKTMESKLIKGLFFAGEIIDVDAYTGGFNLQIAFATARLAATFASI